MTNLFNRGLSAITMYETEKKIDPYQVRVKKHSFKSYSKSSVLVLGLKFCSVGLSVPVPKYNHEEIFT